MTSSVTAARAGVQPAKAKVSPAVPCFVGLTGFAMSAGAVP